jgi:GGDEF domain-containing protein
MCHAVIIYKYFNSINKVFKYLLMHALLCIDLDNFIDVNIYTNKLYTHLIILILTIYNIK